MERVHSRIRNPAWTSFPVSYQACGAVCVCFLYTMPIDINSIYRYYSDCCVTVNTGAGFWPLNEKSMTAAVSCCDSCSLVLGRRTLFFFSCAHSEYRRHVFLVPATVYKGLCAYSYVTVLYAIFCLILLPPARFQGH